MLLHHLVIFLTLSLGISLQLKTYLMLPFLLPGLLSCCFLLPPASFFLPSLSAQAPKAVKVFINLPRSMGFDDAERSEATQAMELSEEDYKDDGLIPLRYVKFQNVQSVTVRTT